MNRVPFVSLAGIHGKLRGEVLRVIEEVHDSGRFILGDRVAAFEEAYARFSGTRYCVGLGSGLDALELALRSLGLGPGDEVIVPSNTFIATWFAVSRTGAEVVPVEPELETANLDPGRVAEAIGPRTRAVIPVHLQGRVCDMDPIVEIAESHSIAVVEDNAQAQGAHSRDRRAGSIGRINATSFYPTKILGALGDGGAVTTDDAELAETVRALGNYGSSAKHRHEIAGGNSRLDEVQAAVLTVKLGHVEWMIAERRRAAEWYREALSDIEGVLLPKADSGFDHVYHLFVVRTRHRDPLQHHLAECGIGTMVHYPVPPHLQPAYRHLGFAEGSYPIAEELARTSLSLPFFVGISREQVRLVAAEIAAFFERTVSDPRS